MSSFAVGLSCAAASVLLFGSNFVVTKKYKTGDGVFFQFVMCSAIWIAGCACYVAQCYSNGGVCPSFQPVAMIGGMIWATGNICVVPIVKTLGLSLGLLTWSVSNMVIGWAGGLGIGGLSKDSIAHPSMNYAGVAVGVFALTFYLFLRPSVNIEVQIRKKVSGLYDDDILDDQSYPLLIAEQLSSDNDESMWTDRLTPFNKKLFGFLLALFSGVCYGLNFDPPNYIINNIHNYPGASDKLFDYVFPHFCGILVASTFYFQIYCIFKGNAPKIYKEIAFPGFLSGIMWAGAQIAYFKAIESLDMSIAFPLVSIGPGLVSTLWGVFVFRELTGKRNYLLLIGAFITSAISASLIVLSK